MNDTQPLDAVRGLPLTDYMLVYGGSLVLGIGERAEDTRETEWNLFVESAWRLEHNGQPILASLDTCVETRDEAGPFLAVLGRLCGQTIMSIDTGQNVKDLAISFTSGYVLTTFSHSLDGSSWVLRHRDGVNIGMDVDITRVRMWTSESDHKEAQPPAAGYGSQARRT